MGYVEEKIEEAVSIYADLKFQFYLISAEINKEPRFLNYSGTFSELNLKGNKKFSDLESAQNEQKQCKRKNTKIHKVTILLEDQ